MHSTQCASPGLQELLHPQSGGAAERRRGAPAFIYTKPL